MTASTTTTSPVFVELDPRSLAAHPGNIRDDLGDLTELTSSIKAVGVLEPVIITAVTDDGAKSAKTRTAYRILAGHRRVAAAIKAKATTVLCIVRVDLDSDVDSLTTMIVENVHRADLSATEEAAAYAQLAAFDLSPAQIAERTGRKTKTVRDALKLHRLPDSVRQPVADGAITLEQAAEIARFADDEKAHARLMKAAQSGYGLSYAIAEEKHRRARTQRKAKNKETLAKAGVKVIAKPKGYPYDGPVAPSAGSASLTAPPATPWRPTQTALGTRRSSTPRRVSRYTCALTRTATGTFGSPPAATSALTRRRDERPRKRRRPSGPRRSWLPGRSGASSCALWSPPPNSHRP
jgi:ParB/RepB/Spo0J family partition protein